MEILQFTITFDPQKNWNGGSSWTWKLVSKIWADSIRAEDANVL